MNTIKGLAKKFYDDTKGYLQKVPRDQQYSKNGKLSPQEFLEACKKLLSINRNWEWGQTHDKSQVNKFLPLEQQFIKTEIISNQRLKDNEDTEGIVLYDSFNLEEILKQDQQIKEVQKIEKPKKQKKLETIESDSDLEDYNDQQNEINQKERTYKLYINYDLAEQVPRFWISGMDCNNQPLTEEQIYEDIVQEYRQKTVTKEYNPYVGIDMYNANNTI